MKTLDASLKTKREIEWEEVEQLILLYQKGFEDASFKEASLEAANELIARFSPLFVKYLKILNGGEINFYDLETKCFVFSFIDQSMRSKFPSNKKNIIYRFRFVIKTYGTLKQDEILSDIHEIFFRIAKRYKQVGRNFCGYLYNVFYHEMSRHIKKHIENPLNIPYRMNELIEQRTENCSEIEDYLSDFHEKQEVLDFDWISGKDCDDVFSSLSVLDRKILMAYYIDDQNDKQIAQSFGIHINTVNQRRRKALYEVLNKMPNRENLSIKRSRKVSKK